MNLKKIKIISAILAINVLSTKTILANDNNNSTRGVDGLIQLLQVVPGGQESKEGKTTKEIMNALSCKPNHDLLPSGGNTEHTTYVNSCYVDDALYLGEDSNYYYIYLSGYEGKVAKSVSHYFDLDLNNDGKKVTYEIQTIAQYIPAGANVLSASSDKNQANTLNFSSDYLDKSQAETMAQYSSVYVQSPSYYTNENGTLIHYVTNNVTEANNYSRVIAGKAPSWMKQNSKFYSYDGIYFYSDWRNIKVSGSGAFNATNPFYNYYQFLPFRSMSNYLPQQVDNFTKSYKYTSVPTVYPAKSNESNLVNTGIYFYNVQQKFGINGALQYAMGIHESGWGRSRLSIEKNNLFGMNATDNNPYGNGTSFKTVESGIEYHADRYLSYGYTDPIDDWRYYGSHVGNKGSGMNVKYASDPFWGEKIAGWYYRFDQANGFKDHDFYSIGIKESNIVTNVQAQSSQTSTTLYQTKNKKSNIKLVNYPVLIVGENNGYYRVMTDTPIINGKPLYSGKYDWINTTGYIQEEYIRLVNHKNYAYPYSLIKNSWQQIDDNWYYFNHAGAMQTEWLNLGSVWYYFNDNGVMQTGWQNINGLWYYFTPTGEMVTNKVIDGWIIRPNGVAFGPGWTYCDNYWYYNNNGTLQTAWLKLNNDWYYFNENSEMVTGWLTRGGKTYYLNDSGVMQIGWSKINNNWYYFDSNGYMKTNTVVDNWMIGNDGIAYSPGWNYINGKYYYLYNDATMHRGWLNLNNVWYFMGNDGVMKTGWLTVNNQTYYLKQTGEMVKDWNLISGTWYFFDQSGSMQTGWIQVSGIYYYLNASGAMQTGWITWNGNQYYTNSSGAMLTGWQVIGNSKYYFYSSGEMAKNTVIDGIVINQNGIAQ